MEKATTSHHTDDRLSPVAARCTVQHDANGGPAPLVGVFRELPDAAAPTATR